MNTTDTTAPRPTGSYTIINHTARVRLGVSITEYCVFDLIDHLATNATNNTGWCYAAKETIASYLSVDRATVFRIMNKGFAMGLLEKHPEKPMLLKTTRQWSDALWITQGITRWITPDDRLKMRLAPSQNATKKGRKMRRNNNIYNNIYNNTVKKNFERKTSVTKIGDILKQYQLPKHDASALTDWEAEAQRLWHALALPGAPSQRFYTLVKRAYDHGEQSRLLRAFSYCQDAPEVQDKERLFYWRYAHDRNITHGSG